MSKAEKTKEFIIEKSATLFNRKGYAGTSLNDLIEATGLTKGAIYGNFTNKDEVAVAVYQYNVASLNKKISDYISSKNTNFEKLIAFTDFYRDNWKKIFEKGGCPIQNASIEADDHIVFLKKHVQSSIKTLAGRLMIIIEEGKKNAEFKTKTDAQEYAYSMITILEGGLMLSKIMNDHRLLYAALDRMVDIINKEIKR